MTRRSRPFSSPRGRQQFSLILLAAAGLVAGLGALIRCLSTPGTGAHSAGYLFDAAGWLMAFVAAIFEARSADLFFQIRERAARRRAILLAMGGIAGMLLGCYLASFAIGDESPALAVAGANALLVGGLGCGLAGLFSLGWFYGGGYAARRVEKLSDEEW